MHPFTSTYVGTPELIAQRKQLKAVALKIAKWKRIPKRSLAQSYLTQISIRGVGLLDITRGRKMMMTVLFSNQHLRERKGMGMEAEIKQDDCPTGARPASYRSVGWWPRPWQRRRCHQSSRTCRASSDAHPASLGPALQQSRRTRWEWHLQSCQEVQRIREIRACTANVKYKGQSQSRL